MQGELFSKDRHDFSRAENINPDMLRWTRQHACLSAEEAAKSLKLKSSKKKKAADKIKEFESGEVKPTRLQLQKFAKYYQYPLSVFYLSEPPRIGDRGEDFRALDQEISPREAALLDTILRTVRARQGLVKSILEEDDGNCRSYVGSIDTSIEPGVAAESIRQLLKISNDRSFWSKQNNADDLFSALREKVESIGVFVLLIGNLGSRHTNVSEQVFRGFAIADTIAPFIVINPLDAKDARSFTLIHELVHIILGSTGISSVCFVRSTHSQELEIEKYCNDVTGEFLLPSTLLEGLEKLESVPEAEQIIIELAKIRNVSKSMIAYRLWRENHIIKNQCDRLLRKFRAEWLENKERVRLENRQSKSQLFPRNMIHKFHMGNALVGFVDQALKSEVLTHTKAAKILGVKVSDVEPLLNLSEI